MARDVLRERTGWAALRIFGNSDEGLGGRGRYWGRRCSILKAHVPQHVEKTCCAQTELGISIWRWESGLGRGEYPHIPHISIQHPGLAVNLALSSASLPVGPCRV